MRDRAAIIFCSQREYIAPVVFDMFYFFGILKEGLTAFFKFTALLVFLDSSLSCRKAGYRYAEGGA